MHDKVDSDVPSEVSGILIEKKFNVDDVVEVGETFAWLLMLMVYIF